MLNLEDRIEIVAILVEQKTHRFPENVRMLLMQKKTQFF
jgi:hypothetical protein